MVNSHYVPQFVLRHFCSNEKIQYFDVNTNAIESRNIKSAFSEKGYYPVNIEKALCQKIEVQFANVFNKRIVNERYRISLSTDDLFVLKKYLLITMLRVKDDDLSQNIWFQELKKSEIIPANIEAKDFLREDFFENINRVLECKNLDELIDWADKDISINLFTFIKDVVYSYLVFVRTNNSKEDFVIPDRGWAGYRGPMGMKKLNAMIDMLQLRYDPYIDMLLHMSSPQDYAIYPLSRTLAVITVSSAFKICLPGARYNIIYPVEAPSLSQCLGFGNSDVIALPENRIKRDGSREYRYTIKQLPKNDVVFLNNLLIKNCDSYFGFAERERMVSTLYERHNRYFTTEHATRKT